uniref:Uncharacterized protein n=1 Tax=Myotis myotis TaxID=51298 RepID=A0A7J8AMF4_MYOMY|nr:hypothetical protein mMyoMyo1_007917 [Myotis myotis]
MQINCQLSWQLICICRWKAAERRLKAAPAGAVMTEGGSRQSEGLGPGCRRKAGASNQGKGRPIARIFSCNRPLVSYKSLSYKSHHVALTVLWFFQYLEASTPYPWALVYQDHPRKSTPHEAMDFILLIRTKNLLKFSSWQLKCLKANDFFQVLQKPEQSHFLWKRRLLAPSEK